MPIIPEFPGTDFHDANLDWVIAQVKRLIAEWGQTQEDWAELQADNTAFKERIEGEWDEVKSYILNYFANLDVTQEISNKINQMAADGSLLTVIRSTVQDSSAATATAWLNAHITQETGYVLDDTLTVAGAAADAKAAGRLNSHLVQADFEQGSYDPDEDSSALVSNSKKIRLKVPIHMPAGTMVTTNLGTGWFVTFHEMKSASRTTVNNTYTGYYERPGTGSITVQNECYLMIVAGQYPEATTAPTDYTDGKIIIGGNPVYQISDTIRNRTYGLGSLVSGDYTATVGINTSNAKRKRLWKPIRVKSGSRVSFNLGESLYVIVYYMTDEDMSGSTALGYVNATQIIAASQITDFVFPADGFLMFNLQNAATTGASTALSFNDMMGFTFTIEEIANSDYSVVADAIGAMNSDTFTDAATLLANAVGGDDCFAFFTDMHRAGPPYQNVAYCVALIDKIRKTVLNFPTSCVIFGGDLLTTSESVMTTITHAQAIQANTQFTNICEALLPNYYQVFGNHDDNYTSSVADSTLSQAEIDMTMFRKTHRAYYKFDTVNGTTMYCFDSGKNKVGNDYNVPMDTYKWGQVAWFAQSLLSDDPAHSVCVVHIIRNNNSNLPLFPFTSHLIDIAAAYNGRTTVTKNGTTYDFTNCTGKVEFFLGGHIHGEAHNAMYSGIYCVMRKNASPDSAMLVNTPNYDIVICKWASGGEDSHALFLAFGTGTSLDINLATGVETELE